MIQLSFQPAFDPLHTIFRLLRLRSILLERGPLEIDHVCILDFYLTFPFRLSSVRFKRNDASSRSLAKAYSASQPYGSQPDDRIIAARMRSIQLPAMEALAAKSLIDTARLHEGSIAATGDEPPMPLMSRVNEANERDKPLLALLDLFAKYELHGLDGLKARTGLLEYRYDAI